MNRPVWSSHSPLSGCELIEPLLTLYADGFASPAETRLVDTHLPDCAGCRAALTWIQVTHAALASRPVAVPPPDLHSRIALAIASSPAAPVRLHSSRVFALRVAYAAAASLTALGIALGLSHSLWHTQSQVGVKQTAPPQAIATVPAVVNPHKLLAVKKHAQVASHPVEAAPVKRLPAAHKALPVPETPEYVATNIVPETRPTVKAVLAKIPARGLVPSKLVIAKVTKMPTNTVKLPLPKHTMPDTPRVAKVFKEPTRIPVDIKPPTVRVDPPVQTAHNEVPAPKLDNGLGPVNAFAIKMRTVSYSASAFTVRQSSRGAANMMHTVDGENATNIVDIHGNQ